jgi:hypothetical protein
MANILFEIIKGIEANFKKQEYAKITLINLSILPKGLCKEFCVNGSVGYAGF